MKKLVLFLDTETTGCVDMRTPYDDLSLWPHIVQLAMSMVEVDFSDAGIDSFTPIKSESLYVQLPFGFKQSSEVVAVHRITDDFLQENGAPVAEVMKVFLQWFEEANLVCAYNSVFDMKMIKAELLRLGVEQHLRVKPWIDPMFHASSYLLTLGLRKRGYFNLSMSFKHLVGEPLPVDAHNAVVDVQMLEKVFLALSSRAKECYNLKHVENIILNNEKKRKELYGV